MLFVAQHSIQAVAESLPASEPIAQRATPNTGISNVTVSVPSPFGQYFFNIRWGKEKRSAERLERDGAVSKEKISIFYTLLFWNLLSLIGLGVMVVLYVVKSKMGIDLFASKSFLHDMFYPPR